MGSSYPLGGDLEMVTVSTSSLRDTLNSMYDRRHRQAQRLGSSGLFEYLWDVKELALMEGRSCIQVPTSWLKELEQDLTQAEFRH